MSIIIQNLSKTFHSGGQKIPVLRSISLTIPAGRSCVLMGPNGAGKTTLLKILSTLVMPDSGEASIAGWHILRDPAKARRSIGLACDTERSFYQVLSVEENLKFYGRLMGLGPAAGSRMEKLMQETGLDRYRSMKMSHCSSGTRQKAALVRALLPDPPVLLIDEPMKSLDPDARKEISRFIKEIIAGGNKTCLMVSHEIEEAGSLADMAVRLKDGNLS